MKGNNFKHVIVYTYFMLEIVPFHTSSIGCRLQHNKLRGVVKVK